jgi:hypothetical protein
MRKKEVKVYFAEASQLCVDFMPRENSLYSPDAGLWGCVELLRREQQKGPIPLSCFGGLERGR